MDHFMGTVMQTNQDFTIINTGKKYNDRSIGDNQVQVVLGELIIHILQKKKEYI